jgi:hypothetical protein
MVASIFLEVVPLSPATCCYAAFVLAVALFVKFTRLLSVRNWDILTLFLPAPGLLLLLEPKIDPIWGYLAMLAATLYFFVRCLVDLALQRRPVLGPNLTLGGLIWLVTALFAALVPPRQVETLPTDDKARSPLGETVKEPVVGFVRSQTSPADEHQVDPIVDRALALMCHLSVVLALLFVGRLHFDDMRAGAAAAVLYLLLPYTPLLMPGSELRAGRWDHAWPMAWLTWALVAYRKPAIAGAMVGVAAGSAFFPILLAPIWLSFYARRGLGRFLTGFLLAGGICLGVLAVVVSVNGDWPASMRSAWTLWTWQPWPSSSAAIRAVGPGVWQGIHWAYRMPVFIAYLAFVLVTLVWPGPKNLAHALALSAAVLLGIQFWYADQGGIYILWYLPYLLLMVFRPNLATCVPPPPPNDWLARLSRRLRLRYLRFMRRTERPAVKVT